MRPALLALLLLVISVPPATAITLGSATFEVGYGVGGIEAPGGLRLVGWGPLGGPLVFDALGLIAASGAPQAFSVAAADDPDFAAVVAALTGSEPVAFAFSSVFDTDPCAGCQSGFRSERSGPHPPTAPYLPGAVVDELLIEFSPFAFENGIVIGVGQPHLTVTVTAFGPVPSTRHTVPEPSPALLIALGLTTAAAAVCLGRQNRMAPSPRDG